MSNPFESPTQTTHGGGSEVSGPAIGLMVVAVIAIVAGVLSLIGDAFFLLSGFVDELERVNEGPISEYTQITVRIIWGIILIVASIYVFYGALQMKQMRNYGTAKTAAIVAMVPCLGPCCLLGIPFGIWAFVVLGKPHVKNAFRN